MTSGNEIVLYQPSDIENGGLPIEKNKDTDENDNNASPSTDDYPHSVGQKPEKQKPQDEVADGDSNHNQQEKTKTVKDYVDGMSTEEKAAHTTAGCIALIACFVFPVVGGIFVMMVYGILFWAKKKQDEKEKEKEQKNSNRASRAKDERKRDTR